MSTLVKLKGREIALKIIADLQKNIRTKAPTSYGPMNNTEKALNSLRYRWDGDTRLIIYSEMQGFNHIWTLETGRQPGKRPPVEPIKRWIEQRGIRPEGISQASLAFLIARKIGREGTQVFREYTLKGKGTGILLDIIGNPEYYQEFVIKPLTEAVRETMVESFNFA